MILGSMSKTLRHVNPWCEASVAVRFRRRQAQRPGLRPHPGKKDSVQFEALRPRHQVGAIVGAGGVRTDPWMRAR